VHDQPKRPLNIPAPPGTPRLRRPVREGLSRVDPAPRRSRVSQPSPARPVSETRASPDRPVGRLRRAWRTAQVMLSVVSVAVFGVTGFAWANYRNLTQGLTTADVIDRSAGGEHRPDSALDILLVGLDSRRDNRGNPLPEQELYDLQAGGSNDGGRNTDTMILLHIPNNNSEATAISLPRDSYVDIAGGFGKHKLNAAYGNGKSAEVTRLRKTGETDPNKRESLSNQAGAKTLIATIDALTGTTIDHYAEVNLAGFAALTNAVEGVPVCLNHAAQEDDSGANFPQGEQTLKGKEALAFVRQRKKLPRGDLDRIVRQQVFMASLAKKMLSAGTLTDPGKLGKLIDAVKQSVVLDKDWDIFGFATRMRGLTGGNIAFTTIPTGNPALRTPHDGEAVEVNPADVRAKVRSLTGETTSTQPDTGPASKPIAPGLNPSTVTVDVRNATTTAGLAGRALEALAAKGYRRGENTTANALQTTSIVRYGKGGEAGAASVAQALGNIATAPDPDIPAGHARVYLGSDYANPNTKNHTAPPPNEPALQQPPAPASNPGDEPITADGLRCVN
jgi:LCP family protein required for cell wall assembly